MHSLAAAAQSGFIEYLERVWLIFEVVIGIGFMIFIHELGHFFAAKWAGVRVEAFALGFGPKLFGFKRGDTLYKLCLIPLGGFVKMAGENPGEDLTGAPDELPSKTPFQRMVIFGAGVFMNFLFAFLTFPIIFAIGVPFVDPAVGASDDGGPAWKSGLRPGDKFLEINDNTIYEFHDILLNIALSNRDTASVLLERDGRKLVQEIVPEKNEDAGFQQIGISAPAYYEVTVDPEGPAARAGMRTGDRIITIDGVDPEEWYDTRTRYREGEVVITALRPGAPGDEEITFRYEPEKKLFPERKLIGIQPRYNLVKGLRGRLLEFEGGLREGDAILRIGGRPIYLREDLEAALRKAPLEFTVLRPGGGSDPETAEETRRRLSFSYGDEWRGALLTDLAVENFQDTNDVAVTPGRAVWDLGYRGGIVIHALNGEPVDSYRSIVEAIGESDEDTFELSVTRSGEAGGDGAGAAREKLTVTAMPMDMIDLGLDVVKKPILLTRKLNILDACAAGFNCAVYQVKNCYLTLSRILSRDVDAKNLGGIITIGRATYSFAEMGLARLFFFLAILSINLGFINILPIPILDGGHLMFLVIEKIKGSPVNEKVMGYSQIVGLVLILALLLYVTYNDILRLFN
jgi:regulator of sigma E protease